MTPGQRHREAVLARDGYQCVARAHGACSGPIQAAHWLAKQTLREERRKITLTPYRFPIEDPRHNLAYASLDDLQGDERNGITLCYEHHEAFDGKRAKRLILSPPAHVIEFAQQYGLEYLLDPAPSEDRREAA